MSLLVEGTRWHPVRDPRLAALADDVLLKLRVGGRALVLVRHAGSYHALADHCPHQDRPLAGGWVEDGHVVCPWHRIHFEIATGKARHGVCSNTQVFPVREDAKGVAIGLPYTTIRILGWDLW
jgi:nitrite reductase/ring-hydroxylating ferredoxin subunit